MLQALALKAIGFYRRTGGGTRWFGIDCNFEPSCSAYSEEAIRRFGLCEGVRLTFHRLRRCNRPDAICKCIEPVTGDIGHAETRRG
ncbi:MULTISPECIES: membrane protein insertion efficiency factor YidD [Marinobacter]|uniref:Membrane protein insertion efficiency factor YidD n=1 Tax=Marinobacter adhaerens TaxID=1033846 RepID=A0A352IW87_9GAMM|nr:membrane protein insertion efficiency factor YidD [Marinobacter adhaerens]HBC35720.1 membrane protein insertion efficiency factor YidD [Marinobacter adhaerens]